MSVVARATMKRESWFGGGGRLDLRRGEDDEGVGRPTHGLRGPNDSVEATFRRSATTNKETRTKVRGDRDRDRPGNARPRPTLDQSQVGAIRDNVTACPVIEARRRPLRPSFEGGARACWSAVLVWGELKACAISEALCQPAQIHSQHCSLSAGPHHALGAGPRAVETESAALEGTDAAFDANSF